MTIEEYREQVREAILRRTGDPVLNGSADHAAVIVQEIFANAASTVDLLSHRLDADCYARPAVRDAATVFLAGANRKLRILVEGGLWDNDAPYEWSRHPLFSELLGFTKGANPRLQLRRVPTNWANAYKYNFMIMDDYGYRFEADRNRPAAVAAFLPEDADKGGVVNLRGIFEKLWDNSTPVGFA